VEARVKVYKHTGVIYIMTSAFVTVPFRGRVVVHRSDVYIYVSRRDIGGRVLARYNGAKVAGLVVVVQGGDPHV
jgi:hypothetical protein